MGRLIAVTAVAAGGSLCRGKRIWRAVSTRLEIVLWGGGWECSLQEFMLFVPALSSSAFTGVNSYCGAPMF